MNGKALIRILSIFGNEEFRAIRDRLTGYGCSASEMKALRLFRRADRYDRKALMQALGISAAQLSRLQSKLGGFVIRAIGEIDSENVERTLQAILWLIMQAEDQTAGELLRSIASKAVNTERFELLLHMHELTAMMVKPVDLRIPDRDSLHKQVDNLNRYRSLAHRIESLKAKSFDPLTQPEIVREILDDPLMSDSGNAQSLRARALFHRISSKALSFQRKYDAAVEQQAELYHLLKSNEWLPVHHSYSLIREGALLAKLLALLGKLKEADELIFELGTIDTGSVRLEVQNFSELLVFRLSLSLQTGQREAGINTCETLSGIIDQHAHLISPLKYAHGLYVMTYFYIAAGHISEARKTLRMLLRLPRSAMQYGAYAMARFLQIIVAYESRDIEDAHRLIINFRKSKPYKQSPYFKHCFKILQSYALPPFGKISDCQLFHPIEVSRADRTFLNYFDFNAWLAAKQQDISMLESLAANQSGCTNFGVSEVV